ncbi:MAG TPA: hypothetical protein VFQ61_17845, partial [Polyangiaceae bacterium]|nr:hypothetical protein [Polyangiaceae bacterium]
MKSKSRRQGRGKLAPFMTSVCGIVTFACSATDPTAGAPAEFAAEQGVAVASTTQKVVPDYALPTTLSPIRALEAPSGVYLTSVEQRLDGTGTFTQTVHVYQPDANSETIRFELTAKNSTGQVDGSHRFESVVLTSHPGESDQSQQTLANASGQRVYEITNSRQGWYRLQFRYVSPNFGRTLSIKAYDAGARPLKMAWSDPPSTRVQVRANVNVEQSSQSFLKGGAYRSADRLHSAYADNVTVDGRLLYRRAFDQGLFNYPLGWLSAGSHVVEFSLSASNYSRAKFWFGVNEKTFHSFQAQDAWKAAQFLYYGEMHTADYDAWNEGVAFAQGAELANGVRPPPVRRGTSFGLALEHPGLNGSTANASLRIYPY